MVLHITLYTHYYNSLYGPTYTFKPTFTTHCVVLHINFTPTIIIIEYPKHNKFSNTWKCNHDKPRFEPFSQLLMDYMKIIGWLLTNISGKGNQSLSAVEDDLLPNSDSQAITPFYNTSVQ